MSQKETFLFRFEADLKKQLKDISDGRALSYMINRAIEAYIKQQKKETAKL